MNHLDKLFSFLKRESKDGTEQLIVDIVEESHNEFTIKMYSEENRQTETFHFCVKRYPTQVEFLSNPYGVENESKADS